ncbi:MAG TPA: STAS domain-containing protein [Acidimicrobiales bacterium]|nr:STAS domain-containing protein [Acidimicrobiales bacterium]
MDSGYPGAGDLLSVEVAGGPSETVIMLSGELDLSSVGPLQRKVDEVVACGPGTVVFDLSDLSFLDSTGIGLLVRTSGRIDSIKIRNPSPFVRQIIRMMGLAGALPIEP